MLQEMIRLEFKNFLQAKKYERTETRQGDRNGRYARKQGKLSWKFTGRERATLIPFFLINIREGKKPYWSPQWKWF